MELDLALFESRKRDHIDHALDARNQAQGRSGFDQVELRHEALPEIDFSDVALYSVRLGETSPTPFFVSGMTAGHADAFNINLRLAIACARRGWMMGVGSQRRELEAPTSAALDRWQEMRNQTKGLVLIGNLGLSQLVGMKDFSPIQRIADTMEASAMAIHLNALQEVIQPEGTPFFSGGLKVIEQICKHVRVPIVIKETGCGISGATARKLASTGIRAIDVSGLGGTHWGRIEGARAPGSLHEKVSRTFESWGIPTVESVKEVSEAVGDSVEIWGTGGVRSGLDAAKLIALGARQVGYAQPALKAAIAGDEALDAWMNQQEYEMRVTLFATGMVSPVELYQQRSDKDGVLRWRS